MDALRYEFSRATMCVLFFVCDNFTAMDNRKKKIAVYYQYM